MRRYFSFTEFVCKNNCSKECDEIYYRIDKIDIKNEIVEKKLMVHFSISDYSSIQQVSIKF